MSGHRFHHHIRFPLIRVITLRRPFRQHGYSLMETMLLAGFGLIIAGITATYTLYGIRQQSQSDAMTQRELFRLRSMLLTAHMRAQRGCSNTVTLPAPGLSLDFRQSPATLTFLVPDGRLQNAPAEGICFYAGKDRLWHRFRLSLDGTPEITPVTEAPPDEAPPTGGTPPSDGPGEGDNNPPPPDGQDPGNSPNGTAGHGTAPSNLPPAGPSGLKSQ